MSDRLLVLCTTAAIAITALLWSGCGKPELVSGWRGERTVVIDGNDGEWQDARHLYEKENLVYGIFNDARYLYLYFNLSDRARQRQIARSGLTVWLDAHGGKGKTFGIRYPLAMTEADLPQERPGPAAGAGRRGGRRFSGGEAALDPGQLDRLMERLVSRDDFEILGPLEDQRLRSSGLNTAGIEVAASWSDGRLIYELKVPLIRGDDHAYAVGARANKALGLGLEAPLPNFGQVTRRGGLGGSGGLGPGLSDGRRGRGRSGLRGGRPGSFRPEPLELWATVQLAVPQEKPR
jgi:hypothetical protein